MRIRKAVIPAAGLGTRLLPATKATPKEMLPLADKPSIQYIIEEAVASGIESQLTPEDHVITAYRCHAHMVNRRCGTPIREVRSVVSHPNWPTLNFFRLSPSFTERRPVSLRSMVPFAF